MIKEESSVDLSQIEFDHSNNNLRLGLQEQLNNTMISFLGIKFIKITQDEAIATMPVNERTCRSSAIGYMLNGGASITLGESLAGMASFAHCTSGYTPRGIEVNAHHVRPVMAPSMVTAEATLVNKSKSLHLWDVNIYNEQHKLVSSVRVMNMIVKDALP